MEKVKISISGHDFYLKSEDPNRMYETAENLQKRIDKLSAMAASMSLTDIVMLAALDIADENYDNRNVVIKAQQLSQEIQAKSLACEKRAEELEKQLSESDTELASLRITASEAQSELSALKEQLAGVEAQKSDMLVLKSENESLKEQVTALTAEKDSLTEIGADEIEQLGTRIDELTAENTALSEKAENADNALKNENAQLKNQVDELKAENEALRASSENADSSSAENETLKSRLAELTEKNRHTEELLEKLRTDHENLVSKSGQDELLLAQIDKLQGTVDTYEKTFDEYANQRNAEVKDLNDELSALRKKYAELSAQIELEEVSERYGVLAKQLKDVETSKTELESLIADLIKDIKQRFTESFDDINNHFGMLFSEIFGGGEARLQLSDPDDVLNSDVEIYAAPPGKVIKSLSLLSGGEKSMVALTIYLAILLHRPTPFCMLDEVDAALDEANVQKYATYLKRFSHNTQLMVITHRRGTIELCDVLYGVYMQEKGVSGLLRQEFSEEFLNEVENA